MSLKERANGPGYESILYRMDDVRSELILGFKRGEPLHWPLLSSAKVHRVWSEFVDYGLVRSERLLDDILFSMRDNLNRLQIATIVAGHESLDPAQWLEDDFSPEEVDTFCQWLIEGPEGWRISDYGIEPLTDAIALAIEARSSGARVKYLDRALNVVHCRGDLAKLFIEGGRPSVLALPEISQS